MYHFILQSLNSGSAQVEILFVANRRFAIVRISYNDGSNHQRCSTKKCVLKNFAKLTGKHWCQSLFSFLLKKRLWHRCVRVSFVKLLRTYIFIENLWRLLLSVDHSTKAIHHLYHHIKVIGVSRKTNPDLLKTWVFLTFWGVQKRNVGLKWVKRKFYDYKQSKIIKW